MGTHERSRKCPKCGGTLFLYSDFNGWYEQCLQCSLIRYLKVVSEEKQPVNFSS